MREKKYFFTFKYFLLLLVLLLIPIASSNVVKIADLQSPFDVPTNVQFTYELNHYFSGSPDAVYALIDFPGGEYSGFAVIQQPGRGQDEATSKGNDAMWAHFYEIGLGSGNFYLDVDVYGEEIDFTLQFQAVKNFEWTSTNTALIRARDPQEPPVIIQHLYTYSVGLNHEVIIDLNDHFGNYNFVEVEWVNESNAEFVDIRVKDNRYVYINVLNEKFDLQYFNVTVSNSYGSVYSEGRLDTPGFVVKLEEPPAWDPGGAWGVSFHDPKFNLDPFDDTFINMNFFHVNANFDEVGVEFYDPLLGKKVLLRGEDFKGLPDNYYYYAGLFSIRIEFAYIKVVGGEAPYQDTWDFYLFNEWGNNSGTRTFTISNLDYPQLLQPFPDPVQKNVGETLAYSMNNYFTNYDSIRVSFYNPVNAVQEQITVPMGSGGSITRQNLFHLSLWTHPNDLGDLKFDFIGGADSTFDVTVSAINDFGEISDTFNLTFGDGFSGLLPQQIQPLPSPVNLDLNSTFNLHIPDYFFVNTYDEVWVNFNDPITNTSVNLETDTNQTIYNEPHLHVELTTTNLHVESKNVDVLTSVTVQPVNQYGSVGDAFLLNITKQPPLIVSEIPTITNQFYNTAFSVNLDNYVDDFHTVQIEFLDMPDQQGIIYTYEREDPFLDIYSGASPATSPYLFTFHTLQPGNNILFQHSSKKNFFTDVQFTFIGEGGNTIANTSYATLIPPYQVASMPEDIFIEDINGYTFKVSDYYLLVEDIRIGVDNVRDGVVDSGDFNIFTCLGSDFFNSYEFVYESQCLSPFYVDEDTIRFTLIPGSNQQFGAGELTSIVDDGNPITGVYFSNPFGEVNHSFQNIIIDTGAYVEGCTNPQAENYNSDATVDDGSCTILGCTESSATNYNPGATEDDGSCFILGCMDPEAYNYDPGATQNDPSLCVYDLNPPVASNITINYAGSNIYTNTSIHCTWDYHDPEGRPETNTTVAWVVNGNTVSTSTYPEQSSFYLNTNLFTKNQNVRCAVTPGNDESRGEKNFSTTETVLNTAPIFTGSVIQPSEPNANENLMCNPTGYYDEDGDSPQVYARFFNSTDHVIQDWSLGGQMNCGLNNDCTRGSQIYCEAKVFDGEENSSMTHTSQTVMITNTPPKVNFVTIQPTNRNPANDEDLTCYYEYFDADGDLEQGVEYKWYRGGIETSHTSQIVGSGFTNPGETWRCQVRVSDGVDWSQAKNSTLTMIDVDNPRIWKIELSDSISVNSQEDITWHWRSPYRTNQAYSFFHYLCEDDDITENGCLPGKEVCALTTSYDEVTCNVNFTENLSETLYLKIYDSDNLSSQIEEIPWEFELSVGTADLELSVEAGPNYNKYTCLAVNLPSGFNGTAFYSFYYHNLISPVQTETSNNVYYANDFKGMSDKKITCTARLREGGVYSLPFSTNDHLLVSGVAHSANPTLNRPVTVYIEVDGGSVNEQTTSLTEDLNVTLILRTPFNMIIDNLPAEYDSEVDAWKYTFAPHIVGDWKIHGVVVEDYNTADTYRLKGDTISNNIRVVDAPPRDSEGGGGTGPVEEIIQLPSSGNITGYCGDGICQEWEDPFNCWQDCKINIDTLFTCIWQEDIECNWEQSWFAASLMIFLFGMIIISIIYYEASKPK